MGTAFGCLAAASLQPLGIALAAPQVYALVGVAAMLAANCRVPLTSVLLLFELTRDYFIILVRLAGRLSCLHARIAHLIVGHSLRGGRNRQILVC